ncbi:hypothetical protein [Aeromonas veronii]|uniref:Uncharacterized protein n=1 Tax=Aeromonas veronii TaxID=654 RepID=A0A2T4MWJ4_AERVE|nr:hypothetical protein [Aeromonas veronii]PTH78968.1 hypothetical protein DAA48_21250 [Aeromonas veronii]
MSIKSVLRFDHKGFAYAAIDNSTSFHEKSSFSFQACGNYDPQEIGLILTELMHIRNTNPHNGEINYFSKVTRECKDIDFHYNGNGNLSIIINKSRVAFSGEANMLSDFAKKCLKIKFE